MPVHRVTENGVTVGWQWGRHGRVYRSRAKAEAQARAIFSAGYREDAGVRQGRREVAKALRANRIAEAQYAKAVVAILRGVHRGIMGMLEREVLPPKVARQDGADVCPRVDANDEPPKDRALRILTPRLASKVAKHVRARVTPAYDAMAKAVDKKNVRAMTLIGIPLKDAAAGVVGKVATMREDNIRLIEDAGRDFIDKVRGVFAKSEGLRVEEIVKLLQRVAGASESRARLIGVDQTLKLSSALTQARQVAAGVQTYRWSTSRDERVRGDPGGLYPKADPSHYALEGQVFSWDDPPEAGTDGEPAHPGEAINCRCVPIPILEGEEDDADEGALDVAAE